MALLDRVVPGLPESQLSCATVLSMRRGGLGEGERSREAEGGDLGGRESGLTVGPDEESIPRALASAIPIMRGPRGAACLAHCFPDSSGQTHLFLRGIP